MTIWILSLQAIYIVLLGVMCLLGQIMGRRFTSVEEVSRAVIIWAAVFIGVEAVAPLWTRQSALNLSLPWIVWLVSAMFYVSRNNIKSEEPNDKVQPTLKANTRGLL